MIDEDALLDALAREDVPTTARLAGGGSVSGRVLRVERERVVLGPSPLHVVRRAAVEAWSFDPREAIEALLLPDAADVGKPVPSRLDLKRRVAALQPPTIVEWEAFGDDDALVSLGQLLDDLDHALAAVRAEFGPETTAPLASVRIEAADHASAGKDDGAFTIGIAPARGPRGRLDRAALQAALESAL